MIFLTGDWHGAMVDPWRFSEENFPRGKSLTRNDFVIVLGDFNVPLDPYENGAVLDDLERKPWTTLFIDGNHEWYPYFRDLPTESFYGGKVQRYPDHLHVIHLMRGEVYKLCGATLFCMGGAASVVDRKAREEEGTWFADELPSAEEYENAHKNLDAHDWSVDFVLTHTCATRLLPEAIGYDHGPQHVQTDELTDFLDDLEDKLTYSHWYFGHFHDNRELLDRKHTLLFDRIVRIV